MISNIVLPGRKLLVSTGKYLPVEEYLWGNFCQDKAFQVDSNDQYQLGLIEFDFLPSVALSIVVNPI